MWSSKNNSSQGHPVDPLVIIRLPRVSITIWKCAINQCLVIRSALTQHSNRRIPHLAHQKIIRPVVGKWMDWIVNLRWQWTGKSKKRFWKANLKTCFKSSRQCNLGKSRTNYSRLKAAVTWFRTKMLTEVEIAAYNRNNLIIVTNNRFASVVFKSKASRVDECMRGKVILAHINSFHHHRSSFFQSLIPIQLAVKTKTFTWKILHPIVHNVCLSTKLSSVLVLQLKIIK